MAVQILSGLQWTCTWWLNSFSFFCNSHELLNGGTIPAFCNRVPLYANWQSVVSPSEEFHNNLFFSFYQNGTFKVECPNYRNLGTTKFDAVAKPGVESGTFAAPGTINWSTILLHLHGYYEILANWSTHPRFLSRVILPLNILNWSERMKHLLLKKSFG